MIDSTLFFTSPVLELAEIASQIIDGPIPPPIPPIGWFCAA